ncbi:TonB family protein [Luteimonas sp. 22616]|uniref:energy transducer TonB n=1 Tax=Luteimonas sp. 22616 TaxID=3453951 RepID=UPI003F86BA97
MSPLAPDARPAHLRLALGVLLVIAISACGKKEDAAPAAGGATPTAATQPAQPPAQAVSAEVAALSADDLRKKATQAYQESKLYAPAGDNAMEYYLALRDKLPGDPGVSSALTDLLPMTVIATEQSRDRGDFDEAQRLFGLIEKADKDHPSLARLKASIATAQDAEIKRAEEQKLSAEEEAAKKAQLEKERAAQQQLQQQQVAEKLAAQQAEQAAAAKREADQKAAAEREAEQKAAQQRAAQQTPKPVEKATVSANDLRPISTPAPRYPIDALRAGQSGEVQVEFTVAADGSVTSARVVRSNPPRVFDREAVAAVKRWRFEPIGAPVTTRRTIGFNPGG